MRFSRSRSHFCGFILLACLLAACADSEQSIQPTDAPPSPIVAATPAASARPSATIVPSKATISTEVIPTATTGASEIAPSATFTVPTQILQKQDPPMRGPNVTTAQQHLYDLGYRQVGNIDGVFGANTEAAVRTFQRVNGLTVDGIIGPQTWQALLGNAIPASAIVPIVASDTGWLIGGTYAGQWFDEVTTAKSMQESSIYQFYGLAGASGSSNGSQPESLGIPCEDQYRVELDSVAPESHLLGIASTRNPLLRSIHQLDPQTAEFQQAIRDMLTARGIAQPDIHIAQAVEVDLDGDGIAEQLLAAVHYGEDNLPAPHTKAGDFSVVVLRKYITDAWKTFEVVGEYYPQANEFAAPNVYQLLATLDLNGDGSMEIVVDSAYYEGAATSIYTVTDDQVQEVLVAGCGV